MKVKIKKATHIQDTCFSLGVGCSVVCDITPNQVFTVSKKGKYYFLKRKKQGFALRVTETIFKKAFEEVKDNENIL